jgi:hypothetical protein
LLIASLLLGAATGCFVGEEIDKAAALNNGSGAVAPAAAKPGSEKAAAAKPGAGATAATKPAAPAGKSWWETARSLTTEESDEASRAANSRAAASSCCATTASRAAAPRSSRRTAPETKITGATEPG